MTLSTQLQEEIEALQPWFHNLHLPGNVQTRPDHPLGDFPKFKWEHFKAWIPEDLNGFRVLDVGCNAGYYTLELAKRGAHVTAIDVNPHYLSQARWAADVFDLSDRIDFQRMQVYDLARSADTYDIVLFMGVFYHLRYPMLALDILAQRVKKMMVFQAMSLPGDELPEQVENLNMVERDRMLEPNWPKMAFVEHRLCDDLSNWWIPNEAAVKALIRSAGLQVCDYAGSEIYICEPDPQNPSCMITWNRDEYDAATGVQNRYTKNGNS